MKKFYIGPNSIILEKVGKEIIAKSVPYTELDLESEILRIERKKNRSKKIPLIKADEEIHFKIYGVRTETESFEYLLCRLDVIGS